MEHIDKLVPQNIKTAIKEIGELFCMFYLYYHYCEAGWSIYRNFDEKGYDILMLNRKEDKKVKIEVKTRQKIISSQKNANRTTHFTLSQIERKEADYLIAVWLEHNFFFVVPTSTLRETSSKGKKLFKFIAKINKDNELDSGALKFLSKWEQIGKLPKHNF
jgi:hypothetical protein